MGSWLPHVGLSCVPNVMVLAVEAEVIWLGQLWKHDGKVKVEHDIVEETQP